MMAFENLTIASYNIQGLIDELKNRVLAQETCGKTF